MFTCQQVKQNYIFTTPNLRSEELAEKFDQLTILILNLSSTFTNQSHLEEPQSIIQSIPASAS